MKLDKTEIEEILSCYKKWLSAPISGAMYWPSSGLKILMGLQGISLQRDNEFEIINFDSMDVDNLRDVLYRRMLWALLNGDN